MKFQKTLDLWETGVQEKIDSGEIKLQRGQWLICGDGGGLEGKKCRYVGQFGGRVWVTHWQGSAEATLRKWHSDIETKSGVPHHSRFDHRHDLLP